MKNFLRYMNGWLSKADQTDSKMALNAFFECIVLPICLDVFVYLHLSFLVMPLPVVLFFAFSHSAPINVLIVSLLG